MVISIYIVSVYGLDHYHLDQYECENILGHVHTINSEYLFWKEDGTCCQYILDESNMIVEDCDG